jgi:ComEC/Rec2-related protein
LFAGEVVEVTGVAALPKTSVAEGTFDYRAYLAELGIYYHLRTSGEADWCVVQAAAAPPLSERFRNWAQKTLAMGLPVEDESLRLEWALTLGWKTALTEETSAPFVQAATYHIFAVDGLRMAILFGVFFAILRALRLPRPICGLVLIPLIWFYVALTGWPASAIRATVMLTIVIGGWVLKRPVDLLNSLFAAALIILVWQPQQIFQAGFQMSFLVVLCIILTVPPSHRWLHLVTAPDPLLPASLRPQWRVVLARPGRWIGDLLVSSFAAWIGSLPLTAYYFHIVTPISTPANVLAVPLCGLVLSSNLASLLCAAWFPGASVIFNHAGWFLMECIRASSEWFAGLPKAYFYVPLPSLYTSALYYALVLALATGWLLQPKLRAWKLTGSVFLVVCWFWQVWDFQTTTRLTILPANGAMAVYFDAPGLRNDLLLDCGTSNSVMLATGPFLRGQGVNRLASLVLTHGDLHHVGGAQSIVQQFEPNQVLISPLKFRSQAYRRAMNALRQVPGLVKEISATNSCGPWRVLHPLASERFAQADDKALVLYGNFAGARILLLSDLGALGQQALIERRPELRADVVICGIPSASEAVTERFLQTVQPRLIIIADSEFPVAERAPEALRRRLRRCGVPVIYTRESGSVTVEFRKKREEPGINFAVHSHDS